MFNTDARAPRRPVDYIDPYVKQPSDAGHHYSDPADDPRFKVRRSEDRDRYAIWVVAGVVALSVGMAVFSFSGPQGTDMSETSSIRLHGVFVRGLDNHALPDK